MLSPSALAVRGVRGTKFNYQHDRHLSLTTPHGAIHAVFDGHGTPADGHLIADLCRRRLPSLLLASPAWTAPKPAPDAPPRAPDPALLHALRAVVAALEAESEPPGRRPHYPGSTLCVVLLKDGALYTANVGDSRAVLAVAAPPPHAAHRPILAAVPLTRDHVCADPAERARIEAAGGFVRRGRLNGALDMSRAMGDHEFKRFRAAQFGDRLLTAEPDVTARVVGDADVFVVVASDGLWGVVGNEEAIVAAEVCAEGGGEVAKRLVSLAMEAGSVDNVTVVFVPLRDMPKRQAKQGLRKRMEARATERAERAGIASEEGSQESAMGLRRRVRLRRGDRRDRREERGRRAEELKGDGKGGGAEGDLKTGEVGRRKMFEK